MSEIQCLLLNQMKTRAFHRYSFFFSLLFLHSFFVLSVQGFRENEEEIERTHFPNDFLFGTGTSSYQIEGAYLEDGKGVSNWDVFSHIPGKIENNENGDAADDHYHRFTEDIDLMHSIGVNTYRFSISWARILPKGSYGEINARGIMFYNKIIDYLLLKGTEPFVTIHHHDIPQELEQRYGSWLSPQIQEDYVHYAKICFKEFGDRVKYWTTINEPNTNILMSYIRGTYPPGHCSPPFGNCSAGDSDLEPLIAMHNMLLSHARAVDIYRKHFQPKHGGSIGLVACTFMYEPLRDQESDIAATIRAFAFNIGWVFDPLVYGEYPSEMRRYLGKQLPSFTAKEKMLLRGSVDFIGINHYSTLYAKDCLMIPCNSQGDHPISGFLETTGVKDGVPIGEPTGMPRFFVYPKGMENIINYMKEKYHNFPMLVTENGYSPPVRQDEQLEEIINDVNRIKFHKSYLASVIRAMRNGADVRGYFVWSLMDNFEWSNGYGVTFGLYYVDRVTLQRIPKLSAKWFTNFLTNSSGKTEKEAAAIIRPSFWSKDVIVAKLDSVKAEI